MDKIGLCQIQLFINAHKKVIGNVTLCNVISYLFFDHIFLLSDEKSVLQSIVKIFICLFQLVIKSLSFSFQLSLSLIFLKTHVRMEKCEIDNT